MKTQEDQDRYEFQWNMIDKDGNMSRTKGYYLTREEAQAEALEYADNRMVVDKWVESRMVKDWEKVHLEEKQRWMSLPNGTKVWTKPKYSNRWSTTDSPIWMPSSKYIVNDEWSELRKMQIDGHQLQYLASPSAWVDRRITYNIIRWVDKKLTRSIIRWVDKKLTYSIIKRSSPDEARRRWRVKPL